ncbi:MAG: tripartite tricarboxylate transporter substrate-binding protein, partial [Burkholderiales bacterium]
MNPCAMHCVAVTLTAALLAATGATPAQNYPSKPLRIVTMLPAGGDAYIRVLGGRLAELMGQPVIIDNRPGAAGVLAVQAVTGAAPDGHTLI